MARHGSYIIEYYTLGNQVKVTAIDPESGREVSIIGAIGAGRKELAQLAVRKLVYVQKKEQNE